MTMNNLLSDKDLREWLGYERSSDVLKFLRDHNIKYWRTRSGKVVTTLTNIQQSLEVNSDEHMVRFPPVRKNQT